ncbi:MAG TPA: HD domain-containing protein [Pirellulales bacterium]|jgi:GTP pyrophosphokinase|nr:HD domain-containing protein [Pirellulales bacterium]
MPKTVLSSRFEQALIYAAILHSGQARKSTSVPYISHVLSVAALALENGASEDEAIAALLHDAVEDAGGAPRLEDIRCRFGEAVAEIVAGCTDTDETPKPPWKERKQAYIAQLAHGSDSVKLVSCADKVHNARSIVADLRELGDAIWSRFTGGKAGTLWYYRTLVETYQQRGGPQRLLGELVRTVDEMQRLAGSSR